MLYNTKNTRTKNHKQQKTKDNTPNTCKIHSKKDRIIINSQKRYLFLFLCQILKQRQLNYTKTKNKLNAQYNYHKNLSQKKIKIQEIPEITGKQKTNKNTKSPPSTLHIINTLPSYTYRKMPARRPAQAEKCSVSGDNLLLRMTQTV